MEITYVDDGRTAVFNGKTYRRDKRTGYYLASKGDDGRRKRLHIAVWEHHNGPVPDGHHIHHADHDKANNEIGNLVCMTAHEHLRFHAQNMSDERKEQLRRNLIKNAVPKSKEWHRSQEGREWHREHGHNCWEGVEPVEYVCTNCGSRFKSRARYAEGANRFCRNACKSAYRRKMGYDNVDVTCEICGSTFISNKYQKRKRCDKCKHIRKRRS